MITMEISRVLDKPVIGKSVINGKKEFQFKRKGKLRKDEIKELRKTNINVFDWMKIKHQENHPEPDLDDGQEGWMIKLMEKEERLLRMEKRRKEWEAKVIVKSLVSEILVTVSQEETSRISTEIVLEVLESVRQESETTKLMKVIKEEGVWDMVRKAMKKEEETLAKEERKKRQEIKKAEWEAHWDQVEKELAEEMKDVMEFDVNNYMMEVDVLETEMVIPMDMELEYEIADEMIYDMVETEMVIPMDMELEYEIADEMLYEDWVYKEIEDMEKTWGPMNIDKDIKYESMKNKDDSDDEMMVGEVSLSEDPTPHGEVHPLAPRLTTITEKGVELDWVDDGHLTEGMSEHTPSPGPMEICDVDPDMETNMKITPNSPRSPNFVRSFEKDMAAPPTPSLSAKLSLIELEDEECVCSYNCPGNMLHEETGHAPSPGPKDTNKSGSILNNTDMKISQDSPRSPNFIVKNKIQDMIVPPTPGLSVRISRIELDDEECVCSYNCYNCPEDMKAPPTTGLSAIVSGVGSDQDECVHLQL